MTYMREKTTFFGSYRLSNRPVLLLEGGTRTIEADL